MRGPGSLPAGASSAPPGPLRMSPVLPRSSWTLAGGGIPVLAGCGPRGRDCRVRVRPPAQVLRGTRRGRGQTWGRNGGEARPRMAAAEGTARPCCQRRREDRAHPSHPFPSPSGRPRAPEAPGRGVGDLWSGSGSEAGGCLCVVGLDFLLPGLRRGRVAAGGGGERNCGRRAGPGPR